MRHLARFFLLPFALAAFPAPSVAQPSMSVSVGRGVDALRPSGAASSDTQGELAGTASLGYSFAEERARVGYDVDVTTYAMPGDWQTVGHTISGRYRFDAGGGGRDHLFVGGDASLRRNGAAWNAANYDALGAFANFEAKPAPTTALRTGYRVDVRRFSDYTGLDHVQQGAFGSALVNLPSRTTLIAEAAVGLKHYRGTQAAAIDTLASFGPAPAGAMGGRGAAGGERGARLHPAWAALPPITTQVALTEAVPPSNARLVTLFARIAQSLASRTGVTLDVTRRVTFGDVPPAVVTTPARFFDDGVYDDPFASNATDLRAGFKSIFAGDVELQGVTRWLDKPYGATPALDDTGTPVDGQLRHDHVNRAALFVTVPVAPARTGAFEVSVIGGYDYTRHRSTTTAYNYTSHAVLLGFAVAY